MTIFLPQDPRVVQQQQFGMMGVEALVDFFQTEEEKKQQKEQGNAFRELLGKLDPTLLEQVAGITDNDFLKGLADKELEARRQKQALVDAGLLPPDAQPKQRGELPGGDAVKGDVDPSFDEKKPQEGQRREQPGQVAVDQAPKQEPGPEVKPDEPKRVPAQDFTDEQLIAARAVGGQGVRSAVDQINKAREFQQKERKFERSQFEADRSSAEKITVPFINKQNEKLQALREKESAAQLMDDAIIQGDLDFWSKDNLARFLGPFGSALLIVTGKQ